MLFREACLLPEKLQSGIIPNQRQFRIIEVKPDPLRTQSSHTIKRFKRPIFVAETGEDQGLFVREL